MIRLYVSYVLTCQLCQLCCDRLIVCQLRCDVSMVCQFCCDSLVGLEQCATRHGSLEGFVGVKLRERHYSKAELTWNPAIKMCIKYIDRLFVQGHLTLGVDLGFYQRGWQVVRTHFSENRSAFFGALGRVFPGTVTFSGFLVAVSSAWGADVGAWGAVVVFSMRLHFCRLGPTWGPNVTK